MIWAPVPLGLGTLTSPGPSTSPSTAAPPPTPPPPFACLPPEQLRCRFLLNLTRLRLNVRYTGSVYGETAQNMSASCDVESVLSLQPRGGRQQRPR